MVRRDTFFARNIFTAFFAGLALLTLPHLAHAIPTTATLDASGISWVISGSVSFDTDDLGDSPLPVTSSSFVFDFGSGAVSLTPDVIDSSAFGIEIVFLTVFTSSPNDRILLATDPLLEEWSVFLTQPDITIPLFTAVCNDPATTCSASNAVAGPFPLITDPPFTSAPEPGTLALMGVGLLGIVGYRRRRQQASVR